MRVLALVFEDVFHTGGGMGVHARDLYREVGRLGHQVVIVSLASVPPAYGTFPLSPNVEVLKIEQKLTFVSDIALLQQFLFEQNFLMNALEHYGREQFDIIHIHDSHLWSCAEALRLLWKIPVVMTCHLSPLLHEMRFSREALATYKNQVEGTALCNADALISVSQYYHDALRNSLVGAESTVIHNGIDTDALAGCHRDDAVRAQHGVRGGRRLIAMVARPVSYKGVEAFVEAARRFPDDQFVFVGYLPPTVEKHYPLARDLVQAEHDLPNFKWERDLPHDDKFRLMASADIGAVLSTIEPFGICALEWMALRVPLITTAVGGLSEFCAGSNCDIVGTSAEAFVSCLASHRRSSERLIRARHTAERFTWAEAARKTVEVYKEVITR